MHAAKRCSDIRLDSLNASVRREELKQDKLRPDQT